MRHRWWARFVAGGRGALESRSHGSQEAQRQSDRWLVRVLALRRQRPTWGPDKLRWWLQVRYPLGPWPAVRTVGRWLTAAGVSRRRKQRAVPGPTLARSSASVAGRPNDVWTIDFKGPFRTRDGHRVTPLTVRDLATRCILSIRHVPRPDEISVRAALQRVFQRYGLPRTLRVDNGTPFGGNGARGLSTLSVWWLQLGIQVEFIRPGCPQDNAAHEQMHRVLKAETAHPSAATIPAQQRRFDRWRKQYNQRRPHESLGMQVPGHAYRPSTQRLPKQLLAWRYPTDWPRLQLDRKGRCHWAGRQRHVGRAFVGQSLGLRYQSADCAEVYLGNLLLGLLCRDDHAGLRPVRRSYPTKT